MGYINDHRRKEEKGIGNNLNEEEMGRRDNKTTTGEGKRRRKREGRGRRKLRGRKGKVGNEGTTN